MSGEVPQQLYDEAALFNALVLPNGDDWNAVITWADAWIERLDEFPHELVEISLGGSRKDSEARSALAQLATRGQFDVRQIIRKALQKLDAGADPIQLIEDLYPLTYDSFVAGGLEFVLDVPEPLRSAIYTLDGAVDASDPNYTWTDLEGLPRDEWLRRQIHEQLSPLVKD